MPKTIWTLESIQEGVDRYYNETGHYPTAIDFDECAYLPSARQVQRKFGGMENLRRSLGLLDINYTKGDLRRVIYDEFATRSLEAEDVLEVALVRHFGEPYVHTQKRYYKLMKNRWDFFVYYQGGYFGVDVFSTARKINLMKNVHHKLRKYADVPTSTDIYFVVDAPSLSDQDIVEVTGGQGLLSKHSNIKVVSLPTFLKSIINSYPSLKLPEGLVCVLKDIEQ